MALETYVGAGQVAALQGPLPPASLSVIAGQDDSIDLVDRWLYTRVTHWYREKKIAI
jgi:hypothetical protein